MKRLIFFLLLSIFSSNIYSQNKISAYLVDSISNKPIVNAVITDIATKKSTFSGYNGYFEFSLKYNRSVVVRINHINYKSKIIRIPANAQKIEIYLLPKNTQIEEITVFSERLNSKDKEIPVMIDRHNSSELEKSITPLTSYDFLKQNSFINIVNPLGIFSNSPVITSSGAGLTPGRTLVMFDGIKINKSDDGNINWNMLPPGAIDATEITSSTTSSIYGSDAMTGAVNFVPALPVKKGFSGFSKLHYGSLNTYGLEIAPSYKHYGDKGIFLRLDAFAQKSDGYIFTPDSLQSPDIEYFPAYLQEAKINFVSGYDFNRNQHLKLTVNLFDDKRGKGEKIKEPDGGYSKHTSFFSLLKYKANFNKTSIVANLYTYEENYFKNIESLKKGQYSLIYVNSIRKDAEANVFATHNLSNTDYLSAGYSLHYGAVNGQDNYQTSTDKVINSGEIISNELFVNNSLHLLRNKNLIISTGLNFNYTHTISPEFIIEDATSATDFMQPFTGIFKGNILKNTAYSAGIRYNLRNFSIMSSYNTGYRSPELEDLTRSGFMRLGFKLANPNLQSEKINNISGAVSFSKNNLKISLNANYSKGYDFMYYLETGQTLFGGRKKVVQKQNISGVTIYNSSIKFDYNLQNLGLFANYTFSHSIISSFNEMPDLIGKELTYSPNSIAHAGIWWKFHNVTSSISMNYYSSQFTDDLNTQKINAYKTFDAKINVALLKSFDLSFSIENIFDYQYLVYYDQLSLGRFMTFSVKYKF